MSFARYVKTLLLSGHPVGLFGWRSLSLAAAYVLLLLVLVSSGYAGSASGLPHSLTLVTAALLVAAFSQAGMHVRDCPLHQRAYLSYLRFGRMDFFCLAALSALPGSLALCLAAASLLGLPWPGAAIFLALGSLSCTMLSACADGLLHTRGPKALRRVTVLSRGLPRASRCPRGRVPALAFHAVQETRLLPLCLVWLVCVALSLLICMAGAPAWASIFASHVMLSTSVLSSVSERGSSALARPCFRRFSVSPGEMAAAEAFVAVAAWMPLSILLCIALPALAPVPPDPFLTAMTCLYCIACQFALAALFARVSLRRELGPLTELALLAVSCIPVVPLAGLILYAPGGAVREKGGDHA